MWSLTVCSLFLLALQVDLHCTVHILKHQFSVLLGPVWPRPFVVDNGWISRDRDGRETHIKNNPQRKRRFGRSFDRVWWIWKIPKEVVLSFDGLSLRGHTPSSKYSGKKFSFVDESFSQSLLEECSSGQNCGICDFLKVNCPVTPFNQPDQIISQTLVLLHISQVLPRSGSSCTPPTTNACLETSFQLIAR